MTTLICGLFLIFSFTLIYKPVRTARKAKTLKELQEDYRFFQVQTVRDYYQPLQELSYKEIKEKYNVTDAYNRIGK